MIEIKEKSSRGREMENILKAFGEWHCKVYLRQQFVCVSVFGDVWMDDFVFVFVFFFWKTKPQIEASTSVMKKYPNSKRHSGNKLWLLVGAVLSIAQQKDPLSSLESVVPGFCDTSFPEV